MPTHEIGTWFLLLSLILPRFTLFFWWIFGNLPYNTTPLIGDMVASVFIPRILILVWIYNLQGMSAWFWIHLIVMIVVWGLNILRAAAKSD